MVRLNSSVKSLPVLVENPLGCQGVKRLCVEERAIQIKNERAGGKKGHVQESSLVSVG